MARYTPTIVSSGYNATTAINENFTNIQEAIDDSLSRKGDSPNAMEADLDMNSNRIYNLPSASSLSEPVTYGQWVGAGAEIGTIYGTFKWVATATGGQTLFTGITPSYTSGVGMLSVYVNGVYQHPTAYSETSGTSVTFTSGLEAGDSVCFVINQAQTSGTIPATTANLVTWTQTGTGAVSRTVDSKLKEVVSVKDFGAVGDGVTDDTTAIQNAINSGGNVVFPPATYALTAQINLNSNQSIFAYGAIFSVSAHGGYAFSLSGSSTKALYWFGGDIRLNGTKGGFFIRGGANCSIRDFEVNQYVNCANSYGVHVVNSFNINISGFNIHGFRNQSGATPWMTDGIRLETDAGVGWTVMNNISICDGIAQRCVNQIHITLANASKTFYLENLALLGNTVADPRGTHSILIDGAANCEGVVIDAVKQEALPYALYVDTAGRYDISARNFTTSGCLHAINFKGAGSGKVTFDNFNFASGSDALTFYVFEEINAEVTLISAPVTQNVGSGTASLSGNLTGTGVIKRLRDTYSNRTSSFTVNTAQDKTHFTNSGSSGVITATLPAATTFGLEFTFSVVSLFDYRIDPNGTDIILYGGCAAGDRLMANTSGATITLVSTGSGSWIPKSVVGTWTDIN